MLWTAIVLGLAGSFHCIGMCGPIALIIPVDRSSKFKLGLQVFLYNFGRIITYSLIGLLFGLLGRGLYLAGFQQRLSILMGALMIFAILFPVNYFSSFKITNPLYNLIGRVKHYLGVYLNKKSNKSIFIIGFLNGFLPCGLVYMALIGAISTGNPINGLFYMLVFGIGTIPMMAAAILLGNFVNLSVRTRIQKIIPVFVVIIGILFILRGLGLGIPYVSPAPVKLQITNDPAKCAKLDLNDYGQITKINT